MTKSQSTRSGTLCFFVAEETMNIDFGLEGTDE